MTRQFPLSLPFLLLLLPMGDTRPGWEEEACLPRNRGDKNYECSQEGRITCKEGWIGDLCQVPVCGPDCDPQHGFCTQPGECRCNLGYSGPGCRQCKKLPGCQHGDCTQSFECRCKEGWSGVFCSAPSCPSECQVGGRGHCTEPGVCICNKGHKGKDCMECDMAPGCSHGSCTLPGECVCESGWGGSLCDQPQCTACGHGDCVSPGICRCHIGWGGDRCTDCAPYPGCANGRCDAPYQCLCAPGWRGHLCDQPEVEIYGDGERRGVCLPIGSFLCMAGGRDRCVYTGSGQLAAEPVCDCPAGREGRFCERRAGLEPRKPETNITAVEHNDITVEAAETNGTTAETVETKGTTAEPLETNGINEINEETVEINVTPVKTLETKGDIGGNQKPLEGEVGIIINSNKTEESKDLSKTSSKTSYPVVITGKPQPVRAIHRDLEEREGDLVTLGEGLLA